MEIMPLAKPTKAKTALLIINTGSPASTNIKDVKKYLSEFLMDKRVIDLPFFLRSILVKLIIVPFRSRKTSELYKNIWGKKSSPLLELTQALAGALNKGLKPAIKTYWAMRYGQPSIPAVLKEMEKDQCENIILLPLFPHYAMSTFESVVEKVKAEAKNYSFKKVTVVKPYYKEDFYINGLYENSKKLLAGPYDHLVFSYHSLPLRHLKKADSSGAHCLVKDNCCQSKHPAHQFCYRAQTLETTRLFAKKAKLKAGQFSHVYQSAIKNNGKWMGPDTENHLMDLAKEGKKRILVICPGFVSDNLETLEEIGIRGKKVFLENGGQRFNLIPSLNVNPLWLKGLAGHIKKYV